MGIMDGKTSTSLTQSGVKKKRTFDVAFLTGQSEDSATTSSIKSLKSHTENGVPRVSPLCPISSHEDDDGRSSSCSSNASSTSSSIIDIMGGSGTSVEHNHVRMPKQKGKTGSSKLMKENLLIGVQNQMPNASMTPPEFPHNLAAAASLAFFPQISKFAPLTLQSHPQQSMGLVKRDSYQISPPPVSINYGGYNHHSAAVAAAAASAAAAMLGLPSNQEPPGIENSSDVPGTNSASISPGGPPPSLLPPSLTALTLPAQNVCAKCNIGFRMTSDLVYHMRTHHRRDGDPQKRRREEKLKCPVCHETFRERHHLTRHMTAHQDREEDKSTILKLV